MGKKLAMGGNGKKRSYLSWCLKRSFDLAFSSIIMIIMFPLFAAMAMLIKVDSPGPVFFRHKRVGKDGRIFTMYKFRSMHANADPYAVTPSDDDLDPRVTRMGRILRKSGLDEIPQFFNVLKGDLSVVGPRPEMPFIVSKYSVKQRKRLEVIPGITGLWQLSPARGLPIHENLYYDMYYIKHQSLGLDFVIIARTVSHLVGSCIRILAEKLKKVYRGFSEKKILQKGV